MTSTEFAEALAVIGWSHRHLAKLLGCDVALPLRWAKGRAQVPKPVQRWLSVLADSHRLLPVPTDWRVR